MAKSFTINTPEYQAAQKKFYAYNVANNKSVLNTSNIKSASFSFHFTNKNMTRTSSSNDEWVNIAYILDDENTATLISLQDFYTNNYNKIIDMSAKGNYVANDTTADIQTMSANNIFSKDVNAYMFNMSNTDNSINAFILTINAAAKAVPAFMLGITKNDGAAALLDSFTFGVLPAYLIDSSEEDKSKLVAIFMTCGFPYFKNDEDSPDVATAESDISITIYYTGDDE